MKKYTNILFVSILSLASAFLFQNCSQEVGFAELPSIIPLCRDIGAPEVEPKVKWNWIEHLGSAAADYPDFNQIMATPMAADLDGDGIGEVVFATWTMNAKQHHNDDIYYSGERRAYHSRNGVLRIVDGKTGKTKASVGSLALAPRGDTSPLLVDLDADGKIEIIYPHFDQNNSKVIALNHDGSHRWTYNTKRMYPINRSFSSGDFNKDGRSDIVAGGDILTENANKQPVVLTALQTGGRDHSQFAISLNPDKPNDLMVVGRTGVFAADGTKLFSVYSGLQYAAADLYPQNKGLEIVGTGGGLLHVYDGVTGELKKETNLSQYDDLICPNRDGVGGGPPTIGDFDGNEKTIEIAVATGRHLSILDANLNLIAKYKTQDCSSLATGISSFDFNGDGKPEILYSDEEYFRIFTIENGELKVAWQIINPSGTLVEYPVVVDLDGNGTAEIVLAANNYAVAGFYHDANEVGDRDIAANVTGVRVFEPTIKNSWMPTRSIWHQTDFNPAMVSDRGIASISTPIVDGFLKNTFRRNAQLGLLELKCRNN